MNIDPAFFQVFGAYFDSDLIDLDNTKQLQEDAGFCASALSQRISDLDTLIEALSEFLDEWDTKVVLRLIAVTTTDWFFDEQTEKSLRFIITEIIEGLKFFKANLTSKIHLERISDAPSLTKDLA